MALDDAADIVSFQYLDATTARLTVNGTNYDYARSAFRSLYIGAEGGNDQIVVAADVTINVTLDGGYGNDSLVGGAGNDILWGGLGNDTLIGNGGDDRLFAKDPDGGYVDSWGNAILGPPSPSVSSDSVFGGDGNDTLEGTSGRDTLDGGSGTNVIDLDAGRSIDVIVRYVADGEGEAVQDDVIVLEFPDANTARVTLNGNSYDFERAYVTKFAVVAGEGNDSITVDASVTVPVWADGGEGDDTIFGGSANDSLMGGKGNDSLAGLDGNDSIFGENGNDTLSGGLGNDSLDGGLGNDQIGGNPGNDTMYGGGGNDIFVIEPGSDDLIIDSDGQDTLDYSKALRGVTLDISLSSGQWQIVDANGNRTALDGVFERVIGSPFADWIIGDARPNRLEGGGGNDTLDGGGGDRDLYGKGDGSKADRRVGPGMDGDTLLGGAGADWLDGGRGADSIFGGDGDDALVGDRRYDALLGGAGNNQEIVAAKGDDNSGAALPGGSTFITFDPINGALSVSGDINGPSDDHLVIRADSTGYVEIVVNGAVYSADPSSAAFDASLTGATRQTVTAINVFGRRGNDTIEVLAGFRTAAGRILLAGGVGNDILRAGPNATRLQGGLGDDILIGGLASDALIGGEGNDSLDGADGNDQLFGGAGHDILAGGLGIDFFDDLFGDNLLIGDPGWQPLLRRGVFTDDTLRILLKGGQKR